MRAAPQTRRPRRQATVPRARPPRPRTAGSAARRNGLVARSSSIVDGSVGWPRSRLSWSRRSRSRSACIAGLDREREAKVGERVLVPAIDARVVGKRRELRQAMPASAPACLRTCRPQPPANSVSPQNATVASPQRRNMRCGPRCGPACRARKARSRSRAATIAIALARAPCVRPGIVSCAGPIHGHWPAREQRRDRRRRDRRDDAWRGSPCSATSSRSRYAMTGAASPGSTTTALRAFAQQPDVVVGERGDGDNRGHGANLRERRQPCQRRSPTGSPRRSAATCSLREQAYFDQTLADIFGFHALQIGLPDCPFLAQSRISDALDRRPRGAGAGARRSALAAVRREQLDLIVLPHALEFTDDPHQLLREVLPRDPTRRADRDRRLQSVFAVRGQTLFRARRRRRPGTATSSRSTG